MLIGPALPLLHLAALPPLCRAAEACCLPPACGPEGACCAPTAFDCCTGPVPPFYRFLERENCIARRIDAEAHLPQAVKPAGSSQLGSHLDVLA